MRFLLTTALLVAFLASPARTEEKDSQAELRDKYEKKIALPFVAHGGWIIDYDAALAKAKAEGKLLFAYFTRSYAT
jgi:hypothetical protein